MAAPDRRIVRVSPALFDQLDEQLRAERGPLGEPSAADFVVMELPSVVERFATDFDVLPEVVEGLRSARMLIMPGRLVRNYVVYGVLTTDGTVELVAVSIEP